MDNGGSKRKKRNFRLYVQIAVAAVTNGYVLGFLEGKIYTGPLKNFCVPGLSCYSCPGALGACPIGSLQALLGSRDFRFSFYIIGFLMIVGAFFGRLVCGWLCPFGLVQDLLHKIPFPFKRKSLPGDRWLKYLKYGVLAVFVIILPLTVLNVIDQGSPWFCTYICPSGTLMAGIPLAITNEGIRWILGALFTWKVGVLALIIILSMAAYRPFCRYLCPLGAVYGMFNPIALYRFEIDGSKCDGCKTCQAVCKMNIPVWEKPNDPECIRCGDCKRSCPQQAIKSTFDKWNEGRLAPKKISEGKEGSDVK